MGIQRNPDDGKQGAALKREMSSYSTYQGSQTTVSTKYVDELGDLF